MEDKNQKSNEEVNQQSEAPEESEFVEESVSDQEQEATETVEDNKDSEVERLQQEKDEVYNRLLRVQAEYDNFRKRTQKEKEADRKYKSQSLLTELLPVLDNFERALNVEVEDEASKGVFEGLQMVHRQMKDVMVKEGLEEIKTEGEPFDPHVHQAVMQVEDENYESNVVIEELQKGYKLKDRVIRPAMVKVNQ